MDFVIVTWRTKSHVAEAMLLFPTTDSVKLPGMTTGAVPNALFMFSPGASDVQPSKLGVALKRGMMLQPYEPVICDIGACVSLTAKLLVHAVIVPYFDASLTRTPVTLRLNVFVLCRTALCCCEQECVDTSLPIQACNQHVFSSMRIQLLQDHVRFDSLAVWHAKALHPSRANQQSLVLYRGLCAGSGSTACPPSHLRLLSIALQSGVSPGPHLNVPPTLHIC